MYTRFVAEDFFARGDTSLSDETQALVDSKNGALEPFSIWYRDSTKRTALKKTFRNLRSQTYERCYRFDHDRLIQAQQYIRRQGVDALQEAFRRRFFTDYLYPSRE